jgi:hypothetical protein
MTDTNIAAPVELADADLDAVTGGAPGGNRQGAGQAGLVNAAVSLQEVLNNNDVASNNDVAVSVLGISGA